MFLKECFIFKQEKPMPASIKMSYQLCIQYVAIGNDRTQHYETLTGKCESNMCIWHSWGPFIFQSISCTHLLVFLGLPHWAVVFLLVEDFFHFTVLQVVQFSDCILRPLDQIDEDLWRTISPHELMLGRTKGDREEMCEMNNCVFVILGK